MQRPNYTAISIAWAVCIGILLPNLSVAQPAVATPPQGTAPPGDGVRFSARDSMVIGFGGDSGDVASLFGSARVDYKDANLQAHAIDILFGIDELRARRSESDTATVGIPTFTQGGETFSGDFLAYNMATERGRIAAARAQFQEGFIRAEVAKIKDERTLYIANGLYTTCECIDDPSYSLRSSKMKVVDKKWVYTGPIRLFLFNIATPLWLPFGFLPAQEGRRSGPLPPNYGEDEFGFYLRDWGWYFALNDYMDLQQQGGLWTKGSWQSSTLFRYNRRYQYNGQLRFDYARLRSGERSDPDFTVRTTTSFRWNHSQTLSPDASITANVDLTSSGYLRAVSEQYDDRVRQTVGSSISYRKRWKNSGRSLTLKTSQQQVLATGQADLTIPNISFSQSSRKPFQRKNRRPGKKESWYERLTYSYSSTISNRYSFNPLSDAELLARGDTLATEISWIDGLLSSTDYRRATGDNEQFEFKTSHTVPVSATFSLGRVPLLGVLPVNFSPNFNYREDWFVSTDRRDSTGTQNVSGFFALRQYSTGVSANTTFYGLFPFGVGRYQGIRHTVRPTVSFSYQPDFYGSSWGYTRTYVDRNGVEQQYGIVPGVRRGEQQSLSFSLANTFETKKGASDTLATSRPNTVTFLNADVNTSYNFAADSLKLSNINVSGRTRLLGKVDVNMRATYSPYKLDADGRLIDDFAFDAAKLRVGRRTNLSFTARTSLRSKRRGQSRPLESARAASPFPGTEVLDPVTGRPGVIGSVGTGAVQYADFGIPWSLSLDLTYNVSQPSTVRTVRTILNTTVDFNLTPNWKVGARGGFDFEQGELVTTNVSLHRDFECWQMSVNWVPFGIYQSWGFDLHVKSGQLRDFLRLRQPRSDVTGRLGRLAGT